MLGQGLGSGNGCTCINILFSLAGNSYASILEIRNMQKLVNKAKTQENKTSEEHKRCSG